MKIFGLNVRRRLFVGFGLLVAGTVMAYYWTRLRRLPEVATRPAPEAFIKLAARSDGTGDSALDERAEFFDPTPLFLPTPRNFGQGPLPARVVPQPGQIFEDLPPNLTVKENNLANYAGGYQAEDESLLEVMDRGNEAPFAGFGRVESPPAPLPERTGFIEVKALNNGHLVFGTNVKDPALTLADSPPVEFMAAVDSAGLIGELVVTSGSGNEEIDGSVRDFLMKTFRLGSRLAPGEYLIAVGP